MKVESVNSTTSPPLLPSVSALLEPSGSPNSNDALPVHPGYPTPPQSAVPLASQLVHASQIEPSPVVPFPTTHNTRGEYSILQDHLRTENNFPSSTPSLINDGFDDDLVPQSATTAPSTVWSDNSPKLENVLLPDTDLNARPPDFMDYETTQEYHSSGFPEVSNLQSFPSITSEDDVEEILREPDNPDVWTMAFPSPLFSDSSSSCLSQLNILSTALYGQPKLYPDSEEMLTARFDTQTCGILSIKDGPTENPWRMKLWPMARESPALRYAINAMTAFHASKESPSLRIKGMQDFGQSLVLLSAGIQDERVDISLATTLVLAFAESWDQLISTGITHLRGAKRLVNQVVTNYRPGSLHPEVEARLNFLCRTWVYMDVIARLTALEGDDSEDFTTVLSSPLCGPSNPTQSIDPLMGCASTLFPLIGRVANLIRKVRTSRRNSLPIVSQASELKDAIEKWQAPIVIEVPEDHSTEIKHSQRTAEAYRWATLLYLHQAVPEIYSGSVVELMAVMAKEVLNNLANVPPTSRAVIIHIFPLLAASCEVIGVEDRKWVADRWEAMMARMNIQNLDKCWIVVKEVWERRDNREQERLRQRHRAAADHLLTGYMPTKCMKRKANSEDDGVHDADLNNGGSSKAAQIMEPSQSTKSRSDTLHRESSGAAPGGLDFELTVRGDLHWAGVMKDWKWEGKLNHLWCYL